MKTKHIAFVVKYFPTISQTFIVNQMNALIDLGCTINFYSYNKVEATIIHESLKHHKLLSSVTYFVKPPVSKLNRLFCFFRWVFQHFFVIKWELLLKTLNIFRHGKDAYTLKLFFESQWFLVPYDFELIHAHFGMNGNRIAYLKACGIIPNQIKLVTTFHGYDLVPNKLEGYELEYSHLFKEAAAFTVNTHYLESLLRRVNKLSQPCYILPVGLDTTYFKKHTNKKPNSYFDLVFCGKMIPLKGPDLALEIIKQLYDDGHINVRLHLIGDGTLRSQLENKAKFYNLSENILFYGALSQKDIVQHFGNSDAFILPGRYDPVTGRAETQGLVIQEAQAMELPVLISNVGGMKYGLLPNESGYIVGEEDIVGFVNVIEKLILDPTLKLKMGKAGRLLIETKYDNKILAEKLLKIYINTIKG